MAQTILIVDDDPVQRRLLEAAISRSGMTVITAPGGGPALDLVCGPKGDQIALILLDLVMPDIDGLEVLTKVRVDHPDLPVIVLTAKGGIDSAVEAMRAGANDFLVKPASPERIAVSIRNQLKIGTLSGEVTRLKKKTDNRLVFDDIIAKSDEMKQVARLGVRAAQSTIPILIEGESGVGKELVARAIQGSSDRSGKPFVTVNCGAIPENLMESEFFGYRKGAYTGATADKRGLIELADTGTLFLDEIGDLSLNLQSKLLRVLEYKELRRLGDESMRKVNIRVLAATNQDLLQLIKEKKFREDLFYRLNVIHINIPPLRERKEDIPLLLRFYIEKNNEISGRNITGMDPKVRTILMHYYYPGNVRELDNIIQHAFALSSSGSISVEDLPVHMHNISPYFQLEAHEDSKIKPKTKGGFDADLLLSEVEKGAILKVFERYGKNHTKAAKALGVSRSTLWRKMKEYKIKIE